MFIFNKLLTENTAILIIQKIDSINDEKIREAKVKSLKIQKELYTEEMRYKLLIKFKSYALINMKKKIENIHDKK